MAREEHTQRILQTEEAIITLSDLIDDAYLHLDPRDRCYESLKRQEVIALAIFGQLRGIESARSCTMPRGPSRTCSQESWDRIPPRW